MNHKFISLLSLLVLMVACSPAPQPTLVTETVLPTATFTSTVLIPIPTETLTPSPTETPTLTPIPYVDSLKAKVIKDKLICRYGPGANYLYLFAYNNNAKIKLIGKADGNAWVLVENEPQRCWINSEFLEIDGDANMLPPMYPEGYKIPVSPYYGPSTVLSAVREGNTVTVTWMEVIVSPGKYEDENMFPYIVEVWRCVNGEMIFDTLGSRFPFISFEDTAGCNTPSHGRVYVQEKHGYAGPAEIPWPGR